MMDWLLGVDPRAVTLMQFVASTAVSVASLVVAIIAIRFNYRSNFGARPMVSVVRAGGARAKDSADEYAVFTCRIQNRRKYPIEPKLLWARLRSRFIYMLF
jgi:hypothetical protein